MSEVFLGQIMPTGFDFAPRGFALCDGQLLPISQNQALFSLLGTQYGGDGRTTFALPDLRGRAAVGAGVSADPAWSPTAVQMGQHGGTESVALNASSLPSHSHVLQADTAAGNAPKPADKLYATNTTALYASGGAQVPLHASTVAPVGSGGAHENMQPYQVISYCIAMTGIFPSRN